MGLDVGTTGCKALVISSDGRRLSLAYREYPLVHPRPGWSELDPAVVWSCVEGVIGEAAHEARDDPVTGIAVSVQGEATVPVDRDGKHLYNFVVTFDERTVEQSEWWEESLGAAELFRITGMPLHPMYSINKVMWFKRHMPQLYERTWKFLCVEDFVILKLGAEPLIDYSLAARTMALDIRGRDWSDQVLDRAGVKRDKLSRVVGSGCIAGEVAPALCESLGLAPDAVAVTGGHDQCCGALGAGVIEEGAAMNATGTSDVLQPVFHEPRLGPSMLSNNYCCYPHVKPFMHTCCAFNLTGGLLLRWYRDNFWKLETDEALRSGRDVYDVIVNAASKDSPSLYVLPHFVGSGTPSLNPEARGAILGLRLSTTRNEVSRAILDSLNFEIRLNIETLEQGGIPIRELRAVGGGAKSRRWLQMKADTFGRPIVSLEVSEAACLGAAILAGWAHGDYGSIDEGVSQVVKTGEVFEPDEKEQERFDAGYGVYRRIYPVVKEIHSMMRGT
jgi:xylulokinase